MFDIQNNVHVILAQNKHSPYIHDPPGRVSQSCLSLPPHMVGCSVAPVWFPASGRQSTHTAV